MSDIFFEPWFGCALSGIAVLSLPFIWKLRSRQVSYLMDVRKVAWAVRGVAFLGLIDGAWIVVQANQRTLEIMEGTKLFVASGVCLGLSGILARLVVGGEAMKVEPQHLRRFWWSTTNAGVALLLGALLLFIAQRNLGVNP